MTWPPTDRFGRREARKFSLLTLTKMFPVNFAETFTGEVPDEMWMVDVEDGEPVAVIACVCGHEPRVPLNAIRMCEGCERYFAHFGKKIKVWRPDEEIVHTDS